MVPLVTYYVEKKFWRY